MQKERPLILISNDDGYMAKGVNDLAEMASRFGDVIVVAPDKGRSGSAMAITSSEPVKVDLIRKDDHIAVYRCTGTPVDCVKLAFEAIVPRKPALILSGINHGDNSAVNVHYSGTMGIALEGAMKGIPSIGFSSCYTQHDASFENLRPYVEKFIRFALDGHIPDGTCLNINAPACQELKGMRLCRMGKGEWCNEWERRNHPRGWTYYWLTGSFRSADGDDETTDKWAVSNGFVAVTPIRLDMTDYDFGLSDIDKY
ncbi:MAG: 5'/3'-nucleotidase SurE [Bacteroides sp.]|nr:5'/3'-nucleotidase SurE [Roseburia sp.]MCM1346851.1 5'/3'-nucleotidase SurE [Bacteroides sp.]MCM1419933.1 5'/3'-nucleotidase SurE [Bacteroides sp.]